VQQRNHSGEERKDSWRDSGYKGHGRRKEKREGVRGTGMRKKKLKWKEVGSVKEKRQETAVLAMKPKNGPERIV